MSEGVQIITTKQFGDIRVVQSFHEPPYHIAKCDNGAYVHISGLPVKDKSELRKCIPVEFLQEALDWFDHRHDLEEGAPLRVLVNPDGSCVFEDGSEITGTSQLTQALKPGPMLDAALLWFTKRQIAREEGEKPPVKKSKPAAGPKPKSKTAKQNRAPQVSPPATAAESAQPAVV